MSDGDARDFLRGQKVAQGTADEAGWPYAIPLVYLYEGDERLYRHTGGHHSHFVRNVQHNPRICVEVGEIGANIEASSSRVILRWCSRASSCLVGSASSTIEPRRASSSIEFLKNMASRMDVRAGILDRIVLYEQQVTGKHSEGLHH